MNKKGASIIMVIVEILVVILVIFMVNGVAVGMGKSETVIKNDLGNDLQLMILNLVSVPGDVIIQYPGNVSKYTFILSSEKISVFDPQESKTKRVIRYFDLPEGYSSAGALENKERLCLEKKEQTIILRSCKTDER